MNTHELLNIIYNFEKGIWYFEYNLLPADIELKILSELEDLIKLLTFINKNSDTEIINLINHIDIQVDIKGFDMIMNVDMSKEMTGIKALNFTPYNIDPSIAQSAYVIANSPYQNLDKLFIFKLNEDGTIPKSSVLYKYMFKFMKDRYRLEYDNNMGSIDEYLKIIEMIDC